MSPLAAAKDVSVDALSDPRAPGSVPSRLEVNRLAARRSVHPNSATASVISVLAARFPVVCRMVGEEVFRDIARRYIVSEPLRSAMVLQYGETFPRFLRGLGCQASISYLADIAELEMARVRAWHAAEATPVDGAGLASLPQDRLLKLHVRFHPSVSILSSRFPIVSVWQENQPGGEGGVQRWCGEAALVARPLREVEVSRLPPGGFAFLRSLSQGGRLLEAMRCGLAEAADFDLAANLTAIIRANIVVGFGDCPCPSRRSRFVDSENAVQRSNS